MRGLTIVLATADPERARAALSLAFTQAALGGQVRAYFHETAVRLLLPGCHPDPKLRAAGLPDWPELLNAARHSGIVLIACQTGLALAEIKHDDLIAGVEAGGMVALLAGLAEDRLIAF